MRKHFVAILALVFVLPFTVQADQPLDSIPDTAAAVVRFRSIDKFLKNANDMFGAIGGQAVVAGPLMEQGILSEMFELGTTRGVLDRSKPAYVVVFPIDKGIPVAWFVSAKDEAMLRKAVARGSAGKKLKESKAAAGFTKLTGGRRTAFFAKKGGYTVYTVNEEIVKLFDTSPGHLGKVFPAEAAIEFNGGDAAVAVNSGYLVKKFKKEILAAKKEIDNALENLPAEQLGGEGTKKVYKGFVDLAFGAVLETKWAVGRANLSSGGAQIGASLGFAEGSKTQKAVAGLKTQAMENLELLPAAATIYFGVQMDYAGKTGDYLKAMLGPGMGDEKKMKEAFAIMQAAKVSSTVSSFSLPKDNRTGMVSTMFEQAKDVAKLREGWTRYIAAMGEIKTAMFTQRMKHKANAEQYKKYKIDVVEATIDTSNAPAQVQGLLDGIYKKMFGGKTLQSRYTQVENILVQVSGNDPSLIRKTIDRFDSGKGVVGLDSAFSKTRDKLDEDVAFIILLDLPKLITQSVNLISDAPPFNELVKNLPFDLTAKHPASYSGLSVGRGKKSVKIRLFVPSEQPKAFMRMFAPSL